MILAGFILSLLSLLIFATKTPELRRSLTYFVLGLIAFAVATQKFGGYLAMGAVLIGLPLYGVMAGSSIILTITKSQKLFWRLVLASLVCTMILIWTHFMLLTAQCVGALYDCTSDVMPLRLFLSLSLIFMSLGHWYAWGIGEAWVLSPLKLRKRNARLSQFERFVLFLQKEREQLKNRKIKTGLRFKH